MSIAATASEVSDKAKETTHQAELTKALATGATGHEMTSELARAEAEGASNGAVSERQAARRPLLTALEHEPSASHPTLSGLHEINLKIGVLIIGSLDWESKDYGDDFSEELGRHGRTLCPRRVEWRNSRLMGDVGSEFRVNVPIRYGRLSRSRDDTYTMVFSPAYKDRLGTAKVIRCKQDVISITNLTKEAEELWKAESGRSGLSAESGCVALVTPEGFLNHADGDHRQMLLEAWQKCTSDK
jgi:hypothetical protein